MFYQQGDVILEKVDDFPSGNEVKPRDGHFILAEGELSGHTHRVEAVADLEFVEKDGMFFLKNSAPVKIKHEEHGVIELPAGIWKVRGVREWDHLAEEAKAVQD